MRERRFPLKPSGIIKKKEKDRQEEILAQLGAGREIQEISLHHDLGYNLDLIKGYLHKCSDIVYREFELPVHRPVKGALVFIDGMVNRDTIDQYILLPLMHLSFPREEPQTPSRLLGEIRDRVVNIGELSDAQQLDKVLHAVLTGSTALLIDGCPLALTYSTKGWKDRPVGENTNETVIRGPREAFVENIRYNTALIRRRLKTHLLKVEEMKIGTQTQTQIAIIYLEGIAKDQIVEEVKGRLSDIEIDAVLDEGYIEEFIQDSTYSPFPLIASSERPDVITANLLSGRVALVIDGSPMVATVPVVFWEFLQASEDYYNRPYFASFIRLLRIVSFFLALILPSLYVAVTTFHQEMLPTPLLISIAGGREGVPFPALLEALVMELSFEVLREAGIRLPQPVGQTISIVGALVVGDAAVRAGLVSPLMVIIVAMTGISSFVVPIFSVTTTIRLLRFPLMILSGMMGFYGLCGDCC